VPLLAFLALPPGLYLAATLAAAAMDGQSPAGVVCFDPATVETISIVRAATAITMAVAAVAFLFVVPALLGTLALTRLPRIRSTAHAWSLAANTAALILICLVLRHSLGINRLSLSGAWLAWTAVLFVLAWRSGRFRTSLFELRRRYGAGLLVGLIFVVAAITVFFPDQFVQCFTEDGNEACELARSLRHHFLPYWELETGNRMGSVMVTPAVVNSYWTCGLQTLLGNGDFGGGELATRLPYWIWWLAIFAVAYRMITPSGKSGSTAAAVPLGLLLVLVGILFSFYIGYNPYMADLGNQGVFDGMFTLLLLLALDCLRYRDRWGWALSATAMLLIHYAGGVAMVLMLAAGWICEPIQRKEMLRWGLLGGGLTAVVVLFYLGWGWAEGSLPYWLDTVDIEYVSDYLAATPRWKSGPLFAVYFLIGCGGLPVVALATALRRDAWQRTVALTTLLYLAVVLCSGYKNLHYLGPLLPMPIILFLTAADDRQRPAGWRRSLSAAGSLAVCIAICWPAARETFTLNRELGAQTTIATDDYLTAAQWARLRHTLRRRELMSWDCDQHTWVAYSQLDPALANPRPFVLTGAVPPPDDYRLIASAHIEGTEMTAGLYARDRQWAAWLRSRRPLRPLDRYARVFRLLADGPYSPHNNLLEDVRRLHWPR